MTDLPSLRAVDLDELLLRVQTPPTPTDGPEFHAEYAFWRENVSRDIISLYRASEVLLDWAERFHAGDPSLSSEEWYIARDYARIALGRV